MSGTGGQKCVEGSCLTDGETEKPEAVRGSYKCISSTHTKIRRSEVRELDQVFKCIIVSHGVIATLVWKIVTLLL